MNYLSQSNSKNQLKHTIDKFPGHNFVKKFEKQLFQAIMDVQNGPYLAKIRGMAIKAHGAVIHRTT